MTIRTIFRLSSCRGFILFQVVILFFNSITFAQIISYTDENKQMHFVDSLEKVPDKYKSQVGELTSPKISKVPSPIYQVVPKTSYQPPTPRGSSARLEIFVTSWCSFCRALEKFLIEKKIAYVKRDIEADQSAMAEYNAMGRGGIPISKVGSTIIRGYKPDDILAALKRRS